MINVRVEYIENGDTHIEHVDIHADRLTPDSARKALVKVLGRNYGGWVFHNGNGYYIDKNTVARVDEKPKFTGADR